MKTIQILLILAGIAIATLTSCLCIATDKLIAAEEAKLSALVELDQLKSKCIKTQAKNITPPTEDK